MVRYELRFSPYLLVVLRSFYSSNPSEVQFLAVSVRLTLAYLFRLGLLLCSLIKSKIAVLPLLAFMNY